MRGETSGLACTSKNLSWVGIQSKPSPRHRSHDKQVPHKASSVNDIPLTMATNTRDLRRAYALFKSTALEPIREDTGSRPKRYMSVCDDRLLDLPRKRSCANRKDLRMGGPFSWMKKKSFEKAIKISFSCKKRAIRRQKIGKMFRLPTPNMA